MSSACFELWWFLTTSKIKSKYLRVAHNEIPSKIGHRAFQLSLLSSATATNTFCFSHLEITVVLYSFLFFPSTWKVDAQPSSFTPTTPLYSDISSRRLSLNPGPHLVRLLPLSSQDPGSWEHRAISSPRCPALWKQRFWSQLSFYFIVLYTISVQLMLVWLIKVVSSLFPQHAGSIRSWAIKINESEVIWGQVLWLLIPVYPQGLVLSKPSISKYMNEWVNEWMRSMTQIYDNVKNKSPWPTATTKKQTDSQVLSLNLTKCGIS